MPAAEPQPNNFAKIDPACLRRINLLTAKERPFCSFCNSLVGFTWYVRKQNPQKVKDKEGEEMMEIDEGDGKEKAERPEENEEADKQDKEKE